VDSASPADDCFLQANLCLVWWSLISTFDELDVYDLTAVQKFKSLMKSVWAETGAYDLLAVQTLKSPGKSVIKNASLSITVDVSLKKVIILLLAHMSYFCFSCFLSKKFCGLK